MMEAHPPRSRVGIIGGSFDPVHMGHLIIAQDALELLDLSHVVFIPAAIPPHKQHLLQVDSEHRLNMLRLAVEADNRFSVSDIEVQRGGVSYTLETICALKKHYGTAELFLIVGSDTLVDLHNWHRITEILTRCNVATFLRPGEDSLKGIEQKIRLPAEEKKQVLDHVVEAHRIGISSTEIRMRLAEGRCIRYLVPPDVEKYIYEHGLYQG